MNCRGNFFIYSSACEKGAYLLKILHKQVDQPIVRDRFFLPTLFIRATAGLTAFAIAFTPTAWALRYVVKPSDTLSEIAHQNFSGQVYGKDGSLDKLLSLNPQFASHPNQIVAGETITLPSKEEPTPVASSNPVSSSLAVSSEPHTTSSQFFFGAGVDFFSIKSQDLATGGTLQVQSSASPTLEAGYRLALNHDTRFTASILFQRYSLEDLQANQSFNHSSGNRINADFRAERRWLNHFWTGLALQAQSELFFHAISPTVISVDPIVIYSPTFTIEVPLFQQEGRGFGIRGEVGVPLSASYSLYSVKSGFQNEVELFFGPVDDFKKGGFEAAAFYRNHSQDTSIASQSETTFGLQFRYRIKEGQ